MGENTVRGVSPGPRLRVSAWVDPQEFMNGTKKDITLPDGKVLKDIFIPDRNNLFKSDALVSAAIQDGKTIIDDSSLLVTINDDGTDALGIQFDTAMLKTSLGPG